MIFSFSQKSRPGPSKDSFFLEKFDSASNIVRETAGVFFQKGPRITESYPPGSEYPLWFLSLLPTDIRRGLIHWGMSIAVGKSFKKLDNFNFAHLPKWCVNQYPNRKYNAIVIGSPNGGAAHLAGLLRAPFLTTSFLLSIKNRIEPDDIQSYYNFGKKVTEKISPQNPCFEIINHYDPIHDRAIIKSADLIRLKLTAIQSVYKNFISKNLAEDGKLILVNCRYPWPQYKISHRQYFQVGGLGGITPGEFLSKWSLDLPIEKREESEWGCSSKFASSLKKFAHENNISLIELNFDHPKEYSMLAYKTYTLCENVNKDQILMDCFSYLNPYTNISTGLPGLWLPYNTQDSFQFAKEFLNNKAFKKAYLTLAPSYSRCPDTASFADWESLSATGTKLEFLNVNPSTFPADPLAPFAFKRNMNRLRSLYKIAPPLKLKVSQLESLV